MHDEDYKHPEHQEEINANVKGWWDWQFLFIS